MKKTFKIIISLLVVTIFIFIVKNVFFINQSDKKFKDGMNAYEKGDYASASMYFYLVDKDRSPEAIIYLASCNLNLDEYEAAATNFQEAYDKKIGSSEDYIKIVYNLGLSYLKLNRFEEAEKYLKESKSLGHPKSQDALNLLNRLKVGF